jgi:uncharacterized protein (DUF486 family)
MFGVVNFIGAMPPLLQTILLLIGSNIFMTFAWYSHLRSLSHKSIFIAILASWSIALLEYSLMIPANRIGFGSAHLSLAQLKIIQEVISLLIFMPFAYFFMHQPWNWNFLWASLCICGAVFFIFR